VVNVVNCGVNVCMWAPVVMLYTDTSVVCPQTMAFVE